MLLKVVMKRRDVTAFRSHVILREWHKALGFGGVDYRTDDVWQEETEPGDLSETLVAQVEAQIRKGYSRLDDRYLALVDTLFKQPENTPPELEHPMIKCWASSKRTMEVGLMSPHG